MIRRQCRRQPDMLCDRGEGDAAGILSVHPGDKITKNIRRDVRREGSEGLKHSSRSESAIGAPVYLTSVHCAQYRLTV